MKPDSLFSPVSPEPAPPRLDGDDLYIWAKLVSGVDHAHQALNEFGKGVLQRRGLSPKEYALTNEGYIVAGSERGPAGTTDS